MLAGLLIAMVTMFRAVPILVVAFFGISDLIETKVNSFAFRKASQEAPSYNFTSTRPSLTERAIVRVGCVMPFESSSVGVSD